MSIGAGSINDSSGTISFGDNNITAGGNLVVSGNFTVSGTTTTVNTQNVTVQDPLMVLSSSVTVGSVDSGLIINRGNDTHVGFIWDESQWSFCCYKHKRLRNTAGHVSIPSYVPKSSKVIVGSSEITEVTCRNCQWCICWYCISR